MQEKGLKQRRSYKNISLKKSNETKSKLKSCFSQASLFIHHTPFSFKDVAPFSMKSKQCLQPLFVKLCHFSSQSPHISHLFQEKQGRSHTSCLFSLAHTLCPTLN